MVAHITTSDVQTWLETTKLTIASIEVNLEASVSSEVIGRLAETYIQFTPLWIDSTSTPQVVKQVIAMYYASWLFDRAYSEVVTNESQVSYGATLRLWATTLLADISRGAVAIAEIAPNQPAIAPKFYPTDTSSTWDAWNANTDLNDNSLGPAKFGMGQVF